MINKSVQINTSNGALIGFKLQINFLHKALSDCNYGNRCSIQLEANIFSSKI